MYSKESIYSLFTDHFRQRSFSKTFAFFDSLSNTQKEVINQGYKLHISANHLNYKAIVSEIKPILVKYDLPFKVVRDTDQLYLLNNGIRGFSQIGKFLTLYPPEHLFLELAEALHQATQNFYSPYVPSDKQYKSSNVVFYRYGIFSGSNYLKINNTLINDSRDLTTPIPQGIIDPVANYDRKYAPLETLLDLSSFELVHQSGYGQTYQSADKTILLREGLSHGAIFCDEIDAREKIALELNIPNNFAYDFIIKPRLYYQDCERCVIAYNSNRPVLSLRIILTTNPSFKLRSLLYQQIKDLLSQLHNDGVYWGGCSYDSLWFDEELSLCITHLDYFTSKSFDRGRSHEFFRMVPENYLTEKNIDKLLKLYSFILIKLFNFIFIAELFVQNNHQIYKHLDNLEASAAKLELSLPETIQKLDNILALLESETQSFADTKFEGDPESYTFNRINGFNELPPQQTFYLINVSALLHTADEALTDVMTLMETFKINHKALLVKSNQLELQQSFRYDYFSKVDYGALVSIIFEDINDFYKALYALYQTARKFKAPRLPYFNSTSKAPTIHFGRCYLSENGELQEDTEDEIISELKRLLCNAEEQQILAKYAIDMPICTRPRGSIYKIRHVESHTAYILKEARIGYECSLDGKDAAFRCEEETKILLALPPFDFLPRVVDVWRTDFAFFMAQTYIAGEPIHKIIPFLKKPQQKQLLKTILTQLREIHTAQWAWLDLKPSNILVDQNLKVYFIDFESAVNLSSSPPDACLGWYSEKYHPEDVARFNSHLGFQLRDYYSVLLTVLECLRLLTIEGPEAYVFDTTTALEAQARHILLNIKEQKYQTSQEAYKDIDTFIGKLFASNDGAS